MKKLSMIRGMLLLDVIILANCKKKCHEKALPKPEIEGATIYCIVKILSKL